MSLKISNSGSIGKNIRCKNNPEKSSKQQKNTTRAGKYIPSGFSISTLSPFRNIYKDKSFRKKFCESLRDNTIKTNNSKKKKIKLLTNKQQE